MRRLPNHLAYVLCLFLAAVQCTRQITREKVLKPSERKIAVRVRGDTASYRVEFQDDDERRKFLKAFESFLARYPFGRIYTDTVDHYVRIRAVSVPDDSGEPADSALLTPVEKPDFVEEMIEAALDSVDTARPPTGGRLTLYTSRGFVDQALGRLLSPRGIGTLFSDSVPPESLFAGYFTVERPAPDLLRLTTPVEMTNGEGKLLSAFDLVEAWNGWVKRNPARGLAAFRFVRGVDGFVRGMEAVIPGMRALDNSTIELALFARDTLADQRLRRLCKLPPSLKLGPYYVAKKGRDRMILAANRHFPSGRPYLDTCRIRLGGDDNPFLGFSLKRYDVVTLHTSKDIEYARTKMLREGRLVRYAEDRYFLAVAHPDDQMRESIAELVDPRDILSGFVKAEGTVISRVTGDDITSGEPSGEETTPELWRAPVAAEAPAIVFRKGDPIAESIAQKLLADFGQVGLSCTIRELEGAAYEQAILNRAYDIAIGRMWHRDRDVDCERAWLESVWLDGEEGGEDSWIEHHRLIPLFEAVTYALCRKNVGFFRDRFVGIYTEAGQ